MSKYYLVEMNEDYADEFDVNGFCVMTEEEYIDARDGTEKKLNKFFEVSPLPLSREDFKAMNIEYGQPRYYQIDNKYRTVNYEEYLTRPEYFNRHFASKEYEYYFGTNEQLIWNSVDSYFSGIKVKEISKAEYDTIKKLFGKSYGCCYFPLEYYGENEDE